VKGKKHFWHTLVTSPRVHTVDQGGRRKECEGGKEWTPLSQLMWNNVTDRCEKKRGTKIGAGKRSGIGRKEKKRGGDRGRGGKAKR